MRIVTSREFNQDVSRAKRFAQLEPVLITDRGRPTHVLLDIESWRELSGERRGIVDLLAAPPDAPQLDAAALRISFGERG